MKQRHYLLGLALVITIVATIYPYQGKPVQIVETTTIGTAEPIYKPHVVSVTQSVALNPREWGGDKDAHDLFYVKSIGVEIPIKSKQAPKPIVVPPQPVAPPLPFTYLGKMMEEDKITVYVTNAGRNYALKGGEVIDGIYTVQSIDSQKIIFNYIPLKTEQILVARSVD